MKNAYERFVRPLLFSLDAEVAHHLTIALLRTASDVDLALRALEIFQPQPKPKVLFGVRFPNPIGLAAGLDKNGVAIPAWAALGFGFIEIGTVTAKAQAGNPKPRIFRFPERQVLVKIAPALSSNELEELMETCEQNGIAGIIATNTTLDHSSIPPARDQEGGLSGAPLREKSTALVSNIAARSTIPVVASGGIFDAQSAREKFDA